MFMFKELNLFTNVIKSPNIRSIVYADVTSWHNQYEYLSGVISKIRNEKDMIFYLKEQKNIYLITEFLRNINECVALNFYKSFYMMLTTDFDRIKSNTERDEVYAFIQKIDYTELFYNIGKLMGSLGNTDTALYYISLADKEYSEKQNVDNGVFLKLLIKSSSHFLWNIVPNIMCDFENHKSAHGHASNFESTL